MSNQTHGEVFSRALALQIDQEREARGWTAKYTFERAGLSRSTWERIQKLEISPKIPQIYAIASAYGLAGSELMRRAEALEARLLGEGEQV